MNTGRIITPGALDLKETSSLDALALDGARKMIAAALEAEVQAFLEKFDSVRDESNRRQVVRNGHLPEREVSTGAGQIKVKAPRVRDRRGASHEDSVSFTSSILPKYLRRSKAVDELVPWLYLKGVSTNDMQSALEGLLGPHVKGLSSGVVTRLCSTFQEEQAIWSRRSLSSCEYAYIWADGIHFNLRISNTGERQCILVIMGATPEGVKELVAVQEGYREDTQSWKELLLDLRSRGLKLAPKLAVGDGALGFWAALDEVFPGTSVQRCWVHKTANILSKLPKSLQPRAKADLHQIWMAETREAANQAFDLFVEKYSSKYSKAVECLVKDRERLLAFYDFPAEHWKHLRTTNPIESTFATVRHRTSKTKGSANREACLAMVFKLTKLAERSWRRLNGHKQLTLLLAGERFVNGIHIARNAA